MDDCAGISLILDLVKAVSHPKEPLRRGVTGEMSHLYSNTFLCCLVPCRPSDHRFPILSPPDQRLDLRTPFYVLVKSCADLVHPCTVSSLSGTVST